jgi:hypothetical protein
MNLFKFFFLFRNLITPTKLKKRFHLPFKNLRQVNPMTSEKQKYENLRKGYLINENISNVVFFVIVGFLLAVAYSATIGGLSSLVGTAPNIFVKGFADRSTRKIGYFCYLLIFFCFCSQYKNTAFRISFLNFLLFAFPVAFLMLILCWLWLQIFYNAKEFEENICWNFELGFSVIRFFQFRPSEDDLATQRDLKAMLIKQYKDLGTPK